MSFDELLKKRLGPMRDLVRRPARAAAPEYDPADLYYRRAVGLELRVRPEETWAQLEVVREGKQQTSLGREAAETILGMTRFTHARDLPLAPKKLWRMAEDGLLFFSPRPVDRPLTGENRILQRGGRIARRSSAWPTVAVETAVQVAPMPFMPRGRDLAGAELVGVRFASLERGFEVLGTTITGTKALGAAIRGLLPLLDGRRTKKEILALLPEPRLGDKLLSLFDSITVLESVTGPPAPAARFDSDAAQVTWIGHAGVLVQAGGTNLLVDPLFFSSSDPPERGCADPKLDPRALPRIDAILITHGDNDHLNPNSLAMLPPGTPIYIPRVGNAPAPYQVDLFGMLRVLGFTRVVEVDEWDAFRVGGLTVTACPFEGESWNLDLAKVTYLVESEEASLFFAADSNEMPDTYRRLAGRARRVDLAFMGVSGNAETYVMPPGFGYGNFYADWVPRTRYSEWVQHCAGPAEAAASLGILKPRFAFGYAAGGAGYIRTEYSDVGDHRALAERLFEAGAETRPVALPLAEPVRLDALAALAPFSDC